MQSRRPAHMAGIIRQVVGRFMVEIPPSSAMGVNIADVRISDDLRYADVTVSAISGVEDAVRILKSRLREIAKTLGHELTTYAVPFVRFHVSHDGAELQRLDALIERLKITHSASKKTPKKKQTKRK